MIPLWDVGEKEPQLERATEEAVSSKETPVSLEQKGEKKIQKLQKKRDFVNSDDELLRISGGGGAGKWG